ncbi:MAG: hypothetical protein WAT46_12030, partial [Saprospiraceae bacterium]
LEIIEGCISFFRLTLKIINFFLRFRQDAVIYCIVAKSYDEQTKLDKKSSTVRKNEMHLVQGYISLYPNQGILQINTLS